MRAHARLRARPPIYRVIAFPGELTKEGLFNQSRFSSARIAGTARDGYLVAKASPGEHLGITMVERLNSPSDIYGERFLFCWSTRAVVFEVPSPGIYYLGDLEYTVNRKALEVKQTQRIELARAHLRAFYPNLAGEIQPLEFTPRQSLGGICNDRPTTVIPVYIGR